MHWGHYGREPGTGFDFGQRKPAPPPGALVGGRRRALAALLGLNAVAFARGLESPWLLGG
jgi:hypothetical protein